MGAAAACGSPVSSEPGVEISRALARRRVAFRQMVGLAIVAALGITLAVRTPRFGLLVSGFAVAIAAVEAAVIASAHGRMWRAADDLIDVGVPIGLESRVAAVVDTRLAELRSERERRRTARALLDAVVDSGRRRSSNPLVLASRTIVLSVGTARALLSDRELAVKIAAALAEPDADPRALLAVRNVLYHPHGAMLAPDVQAQLAHKELCRAAHLLGITVERTPVPDRG